MQHTYMLYRDVLGVKSSTSTHCLLRDIGQMPLYFYWLCRVARFWNSLLTAKNALLEQDQ